MTSSRLAILDAALAILRDGGSVTLESAALSAGLTKPGLMYHFPTKVALMTGMLDHVVDRWTGELRARAGDSPERLAASVRIGAYLDFAVNGRVDEADLAVFADPRLRQPLTERWVTRMGQWFALPEGLDDDERARLLAVRLIADGVWFDRASGARTVTSHDFELISNVATTLLRKDVP